MHTITNHVQLLGHVGQDPEIHQLEDGKKIARFSLATHEKFTNAQGDKVEKTYWHHVIFWNGIAEIVEKHVRKGSHLAVEGKIVTRSWEDEAGRKHYRTEIVGRQLYLI